MKKLYVIVMVAALVFLGAAKSLRFWHLLEIRHPSLHNEAVFQLALVFSCAPYAILIFSACLFCFDQRLYFPMLIISIVFPFASIALLSVGTLSLPESSPILTNQFSALILGWSPVISILSSLFLLPLFIKSRKH